MSDELIVSFQQMIENPEISEAEQRFIDSYTEHLNKSAAWKEAFPNYGLDYGRINALLEKPVVKEQISTRLQKNLDGEISRSPAMLLKLVERVTNIKISEFYDANGTAKSLDQISPELQSMITGINLSMNNKTGDKYITYSLLSKEKAIDRLLDVVKLLVESRKVVGNEFADEATEAARMRDQIFNEDNVKNVTEDAPKPTGKGSGRGRKMWTEEQKEEARKKWREKHGNKEEI
jgi:hypothetical protein